MEGCGRTDRIVKGWCPLHYQRWRLTGSLDARRVRRAPDDPERLWVRVTRTETCWLWTGHHTKDGYGTLVWRGRITPAHHVALELDGRPRPAGLETDHLCRVRDCVRPDHLRWVTHAENVRAIPPELVGTANRHKTVCKYGHDYTPENTITYVNKQGRTQRSCRTCVQAKSKALWEKRKAARNA